MKSAPRRAVQLCVMTMATLSCLALRPDAAAQTLLSDGPNAQKAQVPHVVTIKVTGQLSDRARKLLAEFIEPESLSRLIDVVKQSSMPVDALCSGFYICPPKKISGAIASAEQDAWMKPYPYKDGWSPPTIALRRKGLGLGTFGSLRQAFSIIGGNSDIGKAAGLVDSMPPLAVPVYELEASRLPVIGGRLVIPPEASKSDLALIDRDLEVIGLSERQFRTNRMLDQHKLVAFYRELSLEKNIEVDLGVPEPAFSFIEFQSTEDCAERTEHWPFSVDKVIAVLRFNEDIARRLGFDRSRARILVVDTGLGAPLARNALFAPLLYVNRAEMITSPTVQTTLTGQPQCVDGNRNGFWRDVYGAAAGYLDVETCRGTTVDHYEILQPPDRKQTSTQAYSPYHGSFVGGLAAGGPQFIKAFPSVASYIGLSYFRVTRPSKHQSLHVENAPGDIGHSLQYGKVIGADIINMSLKTDRRNEFKKFDEDAHALLIVAAGNNGENLDEKSPENMPAALGELGNQSRMITVGALQPQRKKEKKEENREGNSEDRKTELWSRSAWSAAKVHIAAPGAGLWSFDTTGREICQSGTSAAAALVSFTAGMLRSITGAGRAEIRSRILAAADHVPSLAAHVEDGRRLNIAAALDVFVDRVELPSGVKRGWIEPWGSRLVTVCTDAEGPFKNTKGKVDLSLLWEWRKQENGKAQIRFQEDALVPFKKGTCASPDGTFAFFDIETGEYIHIRWIDVRKLLPTPFRGVKNVVVR